MDPLTLTILVAACASAACWLLSLSTRDTSWVDRGTGLFRHSRHPNFFFEQAQRWVFCAMGAAAAAGSGPGFFGGAPSWTIIGPALLTALFIGSTIFTESISASRYPEYAEYRRTTSMIVRLPPRAAALR
ncbi:DUF1295 domain-containing protein [Microbacterium sp. AK031]|uniref:DUF1295 domain-containing protein n=1 Tax=Microbacterium sp. AK031 TaxID=2723076 RepID=UPI00216A80C4|nr:DUF1295 domain-containing protein [Microbacterium sp. AK031]MCS3844249.1 steroid 5-alpha reductase family enzyme [Microbacterium sp. AK031]